MNDTTLPNGHRGRGVIRDFTANDYPAIAAINNAVNPDRPQTADSLRSKDERRDPKCRYGRWIAENDGVTAGTGCFVQTLESYESGKFHVMVQVHPDFQRKGIGGTLFDYVTEQLTHLGAKCLRSYACDDCEAGTAMLNHRGFREYERVRESHLEIGTFDDTKYDELEESLAGQGISIKTLRELEGDPDRNSKLHDLDWEVNQDDPGSQGLNRLSLTEYVRLGIEAPNILPDGFFVAVDRGAYVGLCVLKSDPGINSLTQGITGVRSEYRHKGIATAMKIRAIRHAREVGFSRMRSFSDDANEAILAINEHLGFAKKRTIIYYEKGI